MERSLTNKNSFATNYGIGATAVGFIHFLAVPFDVLRNHRYNPNTYRHYNYSYPQLALQVIKAQGPFGLWRGYAWLIPKVAIFQGLLFATKEHLNIRYRQDKQQFYERWVLEKFFSGGAAGCVWQIFLAPYNYIERILFNGRREVDGLNMTQKIAYVKQHLTKTRPTASMVYRWMNLTVIDTALYFGLYDWARDGRTPKQQASFWSNLYLATATYFFASYLIYPLQTIQLRRFYWESNGQKKITFVESAKRLVGQSGYSSLYRGATSANKIVWMRSFILATYSKLQSMYGSHESSGKIQ